MKKLIIAGIVALLFTACKNPSGPLQEKATAVHIPPGMGSFSLNIEGQNERTIMLDTVPNFAVYELAFTGKMHVTIDRTVQNLSAPIYLLTGTYHLLVTAYIDEGKTQPAAWGDLNNIAINEGVVDSHTISLNVFTPDGTGYGKFSWNIDFPADIKRAGMKITPLNGGTPEQTHWFVSLTETLTTKINTINIKSGYYSVLFTLEKPGTETLEWFEVLHVYQNMVSAYNHVFEDEYFNNILYTVTFVFNDGITADDGTQTKIHGTQADKLTPDPVYTGHTFGGWFTDDGTFSAKWDFATLLPRSISLYAKWLVNLESSDFTVTNNNVTYNKTSRAVTVDYANAAMDEDTAGEITVYYAGTCADGTIYAESESAPFKAGTYEVRVTTAGGTVYSAVSVKLPIGILTINQKELAISGVTAANRAYNGTTTVTLSGGSLGGVEGGDAVGFTLGSGTIDNANVGNNKAVETTIALNGGDKDNYALTQPDYVKVNITKTTPVVTWPTGLTASYGQTLANITLPGNGTSTPAGTFTWTTPSTSVGAVGTREFNMTFTPTDGTNYSTLTQNVNVTIGKINPTVTWPTNLTATYGQTLANITLPGNGTSTPAGTFTWTTPSTSVGTVGTRAFSMTFTPTDTTNYSTVTQNVNVTVNKATPTVTWPTNLTATYGQTLANITLPGNGTSTPAGTFTWTTPSTSVGTVGTRAFSMTFTPTDGTNYSTATQNVNVTVNKATPVVTWPTGLTASYGQTLANITLPGNGTSTPAGTFTWTTPSTSVGTVGTRAFSMTFTPTDTTNYNTATQNVNVTVGKINPAVTWPTNLTATYGQTLANITLPGNGTSTPAGTFTWTTPSTSVGTVGTREFNMTFTPTDAANYSTLTQNVNITVNRKSVTITGVTVNDKVYDGSTTAIFSIASATITGNIDGGNLTINTSGAAAAFDSKDIGYNKTVSFSGFALGGSAMGNYTLSAQPASVTASITAKALTLSVTNPSRTTFTPLEGETTATITLTSGGIVSGETPPLTYTAPTGFTLSGSTLTYDGTTEFTNPSATLSFTVTTTNTNYTNGTATLSVTVYDGQADYTGAAGTYDRRIPITKINITAFNMYTTDAATRIAGLWRHYKLTQNIAASDLRTDLGVDNNWAAIGISAGVSFTGSFNGQGYTITGLKINTETNYQGMFGYIVTNAVIKNIGLVGGSIKGIDRVGGVAGYNSYGTVQNCYATGNITGDSEIGGVAGRNSGTVQNCYATGNVTGSNWVGGVAGYNSGKVQNCYATGNITGDSEVGGVVGWNNGTVQNCYATGSVSGSYYVGGVVGYFNSGTVQNCAAFSKSVTNAINSASYVGRVAGYRLSGNILANNYARNDMIVLYNWNGATGTNKTIIRGTGQEDGADMTTTDAVTPGWWTAAGRWNIVDPAFAWDFTNTWNPPSGSRLPTLRNMPGAAQNPEVEY